MTDEAKAGLSVTVLLFSSVSSRALSVALAVAGLRAPLTTTRNTSDAEVQLAVSVSRDQWLFLSDHPASESESSLFEFVYRT